MTHEVIVYRSPMEKIMWDFWLGPTGSTILVWFCGILGIVLALYVLHAMLSGPFNRIMWKITKNRRYIRF